MTTTIKGAKYTCELYVGSDFLGNKRDYEELKKDMGTNPTPKKLKMRIMLDGRPPRIDDIRVCGEPAGYDWVNYYGEGVNPEPEHVWICKTHWTHWEEYRKELGKYYEDK